MKNKLDYARPLNLMNGSRLYMFVSETFASMMEWFLLIFNVSLFLFYQIQETDEARKKFSNAKSISSAQFFGDQNKSGDSEAQASLQKFSAEKVVLIDHPKTDYSSVQKAHVRHAKISK
ncbi:hypothetical protein QQ045_018203 [Rhodiola kirilowii]